MAARPESVPPAPRARFCLVTPRRVSPEAFARDVTALAEKADIACLLLSLDDAAPEAWTSMLTTVRPVAARLGIAVLVEGRPDLVAAKGADGVHVATGEADLQAAVSRLKPEFIVGAGGFESRHEAMVAAEAGVDYVAFGAPHEAFSAADRDAMLEQVDWWAEVFEVPCLAFADGPEMIAPLMQAGADFIALSPAALADADPVFLDPEV